MSFVCSPSIETTNSRLSSIIFISTEQNSSGPLSCSLIIMLNHGVTCHSSNTINSYHLCGHKMCSVFVLDADAVANSGFWSLLSTLPVIETAYASASNSLYWAPTKLLPLNSFSWALPASNSFGWAWSSSGAIYWAWATSLTSNPYCWAVATLPAKDGTTTSSETSVVSRSVVSGSCKGKYSTLHFSWICSEIPCGLKSGIKLR